MVVVIKALRSFKIWDEIVEGLMNTQEATGEDYKLCGKVGLLVEYMVR
jgi:hypothetical protein